MKTTTFNQLIEEEIERYAIIAVNCTEKIKEDYCYAFEWGYMEELYAAQKQLDRLKLIQEYLKPFGPSDSRNEYLDNRIEDLTRNILTMDAASFSTIRSWNIAHELRFKNDQKLLSFIKNLRKNSHL